MKMICAWCKKVIRKGPEEPVSHGMCDQCARRIERRQRDAMGEIRDSSTFFADRLLFAAAFTVCFLLVMLAMEGLHRLTGGKISSPWEPLPSPAPRLHGKPHPGEPQ